MNGYEILDRGRFECNISKYAQSFVKNSNICESKQGNAVTVASSMRSLLIMSQSCLNALAIYCHNDYVVISSMSVSGVIYYA
jgi:hypothetical protein